ncbi:MAG: TonB family protein [Terriglobales bacterium]
MSAAASPALEKAQRRNSPRHPIDVPLDVILLRSGVPENLPGRCTDLSEGGVGGMIAGELSAGQQVAVELRIPKVGVPVRARALVRYQGELRCGFEFVGLPVEQREMIRYWAYRLRNPQFNAPEAENSEHAEPVIGEPVAVFAALEKSKPTIKVRFRRFHLLLAALLLVVGLGWWQWQRSWKELEIGVQAASGEEAPVRVSPETMEMRIVSKVDPVYPESARQKGVQGLAVLDAVIAADGTVTKLRPVAGDEQLVKSATEAVRSWRFEPYQSSGRAVAVETTIAVEFRLN